MEIREMIESDIKQCLELLKQLTAAENDFDYKKVFEQIDSRIFVALENSKPIGMASLLIEQKFIHSGGKVGHIEDVVVDSKFRSLGIGKKLINRCVDTAKKSGCYKIILDCNEKNIDFYEKVGFKKYGVCMKIVF